MTADRHAPFIPDLDPSGGLLASDPMIYGARPALREPTTVRTIRRNAGKLPAETLADALCWSLMRLIRVAREHRIDLSFPRDHKRKETEPGGA